jgi:hypothetical protein
VTTNGGINPGSAATDEAAEMLIQEHAAKTRKAAGR